jgi:predicted transcriptional regulator
MTPPAPRGSFASTYVVCLDCGKRFAYDWKEMRIGALVECTPAAGVGRQ